MGEEVDLLREIRDLLLLIAEPAIAKRDGDRRNALRELVGRSKANARAALLMDGTRSGVTISKESGIDPGQLSRFVKALRKNELIVNGERPRLAISIPPNFFESSGE